MRPLEIFNFAFINFILALPSIAFAFLVLVFGGVSTQSIGLVEKILSYIFLLTPIVSTATFSFLQHKNIEILPRFYMALLTAPILIPVLLLTLLYLLGKILT